MKRLSLFVAIIVGASFASGSPAADVQRPRDFVFVLDVSPNMADPDRFITAGAHLATLELMAADRVAVITTGASVKFRAGLSSDHAEIERTFRSAPETISSGRNRLRIYDAVWSAIERLPVVDDGRGRFVLLITNDADRGSTRRPEELIRAADAKHVVIHVFLIKNPYFDPSRLTSGLPRTPYPNVELAENELLAMTRPTGGTVFLIDMNGYVLRQAIAACTPVKNR